MKCFRDYDRCIGHSGGIIDNLDCAGDLVSCVKGAIFSLVASQQSGETVIREPELPQVAAPVIQYFSLVDAINAIILADKSFSEKCAKRDQ